MSEPERRSPILEFLQRKENLEAVLQVLRHGVAIKASLWEGFWANLEVSLKRHRPPDFPTHLTWQRDSGKWEKELFSGHKTDVCQGLDARLSPAPQQRQGLRYRVEIELTADHVGYLGFGLCFEKRAQDLPKILALPQFAELTKALGRIRARDLDTDSAAWWPRFEYWNRQKEKDPWLWLAEERERPWEAEAKSFWGLVVQTHQLVAAANSVLKRY
jgi:hypothetical protein